MRRLIEIFIKLTLSKLIEEMEEGWYHIVGKIEFRLSLSPFLKKALPLPLPNPYPLAKDTEVSISYDSLAQQHFDQRSVKYTEKDVTLTEEPRRFIMSPASPIFCGILILDMLIAFVIWVISWQILIILLLKIFSRKL